MNKSILIIISIIILGGVGFFVLTSQNGSKDGTNSFSNDRTVSGNIISKVLGDSRYVEYSKAEFDKAVDKKRIYYFYATWCPTCKVANKEFLENLDKIPEDMVIFRTDYDNERELKKKYNVIYQHTFVQVDENGKEITKWNGGGIAEIIQFTK